MDKITANTSNSQNGQKITATISPAMASRIKNPMVWDFCFILEDADIRINTDDTDGYGC